jgi:phenylalanyl-tRNA synthetase alpha subunit
LKALCLSQHIILTLNPQWKFSVIDLIYLIGVHPILKRKVEIGNSGIFRPEMIRPMGFPEDVSVIAWGLSLERPTMIQFGVSNIK